MDKYDLVKAATQKQMRISKNPAYFLSCYSKTIIFSKKSKQVLDQLRRSRYELPQFIL